LEGAPQRPHAQAALLLHEALGDLPPAEYEELNFRRDNTPILTAT
jgi:hypothetical protein